MTFYVGIPGFEPGTPCSQNRCATGLRYIPKNFIYQTSLNSPDCLLYTSDAADERSSVDLGGRRIIKKKKRIT